MSSITSRATWRRGCRIIRLEAPPSPAEMAWRAPAAPAEARSTTPLYRMPVPQHTCSLWHTHTHTNKACKSSAPSISSPSAPGETRTSKRRDKKLVSSCSICFQWNILARNFEWLSELPHYNIIRINNTLLIISQSPFAMTESDDNFVNKRWRCMCYACLIQPETQTHSVYCHIWQRKLPNIGNWEATINKCWHLSITNICLHTHPEEHT